MKTKHLKAFKIYILIVILIFSSELLAAKTIKSSFGILQIKENQTTDENELYLGNKLLYHDIVSLSFENIYHLRNSDVILINIFYGGSGTPPAYFFVELSNNQSAQVYDIFSCNEGECLPTKKGEKIIVDLGFRDKKYKILTLQNSAQTIQIIHTKENESADTECSSLYDDFYIPYVKNKQCKELSPETINAAYSLHAYQALEEDSRLHMGIFQALSKNACNNHHVIDYDGFAMRVCQIFSSEIAFATSASTPYSIEFNQHGAVLRNTQKSDKKEWLYLGNKCNAFSKVHGKGAWKFDDYGKGTFTIRFDDNVSYPFDDVMGTEWKYKMDESVKKCNLK